MGFKIGNTPLPQFKKHELAASHKAASHCLKARLNQDKDKTSINQELESIRRQNVSKNREYMRNSVSTNLFLAKKNIAMQGHDESLDSVNRGNFLELFDLRSQDLSIFKDNRQNYYKSPTAQNELLNLIASQIRSVFISKCVNKPFSIIIDETPDVSHYEQVAFCIHYADQDLKVRERFLQFSMVESTTGKVLENLIISTLNDLGLSAGLFLVGQGYDGGSNMSGQLKGVAAMIRKSIPRALYIHCHSHRLNLALEDALGSITEAINCLGTVQSLCSFIEGSPKRYAIFTNVQPTNTPITIKPVDRIRWASRKRAVTSLIHTYEFVFKVLEYIDKNDKSTFAANAGPLNEAFQRTGALSDGIQSSELQMDRCKRLVSSTLSALKSIRKLEFFNEVFNTCNEFSQKYSLSMPSTSRARMPPFHYKDSFEFLKKIVDEETKLKSVFNSIIDSIIDNIEIRLAT